MGETNMDDYKSVTLRPRWCGRDKQHGDKQEKVF